jgi:hypothetical protein
MNKSQLRRLEEAFMPDDGENPRLPTSPEDRRRMLADGLPALCRDVFGEDDSRADPAALAEMTIEELHSVYRQAVQSDIAAWRATNPPQLEVFRRLPVAEKIRLLRRDSRTWPAALRHS